MSFPHLFLCSLVEVYKSNSSAHAFLFSFSFLLFFFPIFIHRILLHLGLEEFPSSEPIHIIASIGVTFLRQRAAQMQTSSKHPKVESFSGVAPPSPPPPSSSGDPTADPPSTLDDSIIRHMLDTVITVQAAHG